MAFQLSSKSINRLDGVHPDLVRLVYAVAAVTPLPFVVLEGVRTVERQRELFRKGASRTMNSRHLTGHAVDLAPYLDEDGDGKPDDLWRWPLYDTFAQSVLIAADQQKISVEWGGNWREFRDGPHWQLPWQTYPAP